MAAMKPQGLEPHAQKNLFGGQGTVLVYDLLQSQSMPPFDAVLACELEAGASVGRHVQQVSHEIVIVTAGEGRAEVDGVSKALHPGVVVYLAHGQQLSLQNTSQEDVLCYLIVKAQSVT